MKNTSAFTLIGYLLILIGMLSDMDCDLGNIIVLSIGILFLAYGIIYDAKKNSK